MFRRLETLHTDEAKSGRGGLSRALSEVEACEGVRVREGRTRRGVERREIDPGEFHYASDPRCPLAFS